jgi:beta-lactam-binding protein with PASTA domain
MRRIILAIVALAVLSPMAPAHSSVSASKWTTVPNVKGLLRGRAEEHLRHHHLRPDVHASPSGEASDRVMKQHPYAGKVVKRGTHVTIYCDCYPAPCPSPPPGDVIYDPCSCATRPKSA